MWYFIHGFQCHYDCIKMGNLQIAFVFQSRRLMERYMHTCLSNVKLDGDGEVVTWIVQTHANRNIAQRRTWLQTNSQWSTQSEARWEMGDAIFWSHFSLRSQWRNSGYIQPYSSFPFGHPAFFFWRLESPLPPMPIHMIYLCLILQMLSTRQGGSTYHF